MRTAPRLKAGRGHKSNSKGGFTWHTTPESLAQDRVCAFIIGLCALIVILAS